MSEDTSFIYLVRHGETDWNKKGLFQGHRDIDLNELGEKQAMALKDHLSPVAFDQVFASDLRRAKRTAEMLVDGRDVEVLEDPGLRERSFGPFEGCSRSEFHEHYLQHTGRAPSSHDIPFREKWHEAVESHEEVLKRVFTSLREIAEKSFGRTSLVVTHGGVMRAILRSLGQEVDIDRIQNCSYYQLHFNAERGFYIPNTHQVFVIV